MKHLPIYALLLILSVNISCSDTDSDPVGPDDEETSEPEATINNPQDGATLEGEVTLTVDGEAENGFDEVRVYLDDEEIYNFEDPALPYEQNITTYEYDNGDYNLEAEFDVAGEDTTLTESLSVTLENYMVTLETENFIESLLASYDDSYLFISDGEGNVLRTVELNNQDDGTIHLLSPEELESAAPEQYSITFAYKSTVDRGVDSPEEVQFNLRTNVGLEPWSTLHLKSDPVEDVDSKDIEIELANVEIPSYTRYSPSKSATFVTYGIDTDPWHSTISVSSNSDDLFTVYYPPELSDDPVPRYNWEENITDLSDGDTLTYHVQDDLDEMSLHTVSLPDNVRNLRHRYHLAVDPDDASEGQFSIYPMANYDVYDTNSEVNIYVPDYEEDHFTTFIEAADNSENTYYYNSIRNRLPEDFKVLDTDLEILNPSMDNLEVSMSGEASYGRIYAVNEEEGFYHSWYITFPDTAENLVYPKIADSLNSAVENFNRSDFEIGNVYMSDYENIDGYGDYLNNVFGNSDPSWGDYYEKYYYYGNSQEKTARKESLEKQDQLYRHTLRNQPHTREPAVIINKQLENILSR